MNRIEITVEQNDALKSFAIQHGYNWKDELRQQ